MFHELEHYVLFFLQEYGLGEFKQMLPRNKRFELMKSRLAQLNATKAGLKKFENVELEVNTRFVHRCLNCLLMPKLLVT